MDFTTPLPEEKLPKSALAMIVDYQIIFASVIFDAGDDWFVVKSDIPNIGSGEHKYKGVVAAHRGWANLTQSYAAMCAEAARRGFVDLIRWSPTKTKTPGLMALIVDEEASLIGGGSARMRYEELGPEVGQGEFFIEYDRWPFIQNTNTKWEQISEGIGFRNLSKIGSTASEWAAAAQQYATFVEHFDPKTMGEV